MINPRALGDVPSANVFDSVFDRLPVTGAARADAAGLVPRDARVAARLSGAADALAASVGGRIAGGAQGGEAAREEEKERPEIEESKRGEVFQGSRGGRGRRGCGVVARCRVEPQ